MSEQQNPVQGMYCGVKGEGTRKCTITMTDVSLTIYSEGKLFMFDTAQVGRCFNRIVQAAGTNIIRSQYEEDFKDLLAVTDKVQRTQMSLRSGDKIITYALGEPIQDEANGFLELSPQREGWWMHPNIQPIVESIRTYLPDFSPWLLQSDKYIAILSGKSSLL